MAFNEVDSVSGGAGASTVARSGFKWTRGRFRAEKSNLGDSVGNSGVSGLNRVLRKLCSLLSTILIALLICMALWMFVVFKARVSSGSMEPTLRTGENILVSRLQTYGSDTMGLAHGDIVVFRSDLMTMGEALKLEAGSWQDDLYGSVPALFIKRVIGLPGDVIRVDAGLLYRNGVLVDEPYVVNVDTVSVSEFVVPDGHFFVMGDNRADSFDGRYWDPHTVSLDAVIGEVVFTW